MAPLRCCSFNCRGWNNGLLTLQNMITTLDLCFIQEHWLHNFNLNKINETSPDFFSVSVSGMDDSVLLRGRPYGGCSILFRKSLLPFVNRLDSCSNRFCCVKLVDSLGLSHIVISVHMPSLSHHSALSEYLNTLGELHTRFH